MSEPLELQKQLADAFGHEPKVLDLSRPAETQRLAIEEVLDIPVDFDDPEPAGHNNRALRQAMAGASFLLAALVLMIGLQFGFYVMSGLVFAIGCANTLVMLSDIYRKQKTTADRADRELQEKTRDQLWEHNESVNLLSSVHDAMGDIVFARMLDGRIIDSNSVFRELTGVSDPIGLTCSTLGIRFEEAEKPHQYTAIVPTLTGDRVFAWADVVIRNPATGNLVIRSIGRDITEERRHAEEQKAARVLAERQSEAKSRLLATVSHEVRTPLSGILGMGHLLNQTRLSPDQANYINSIRQSGNALVQLVEDLLDYSSMEAGRFELRPETQALRPVIEGVVEMLAHKAHEKSVEIASTISPDIPEQALFDAARLRQVLFNVIGNAVKFTSVGGVQIDAYLNDKELVIAVTDTGPGMSDDDAGRIFDEFEQVGDRSGGTGLGLAISARIMREFGGSLTVESTRGIGSRFAIRIPDFVDHVAIVDTARATMLKFSRVLVLAPSGTAAVALCKTVSGLGGECYIAHNAAEAFTVIELANNRKRPLTDIVVDHRCRDSFEQEIVHHDLYKKLTLRRIFLVNPEERSHLISGPGYDSWLIRPLREQSLVDVLCGRMKGIEQRDALNDNRRTFVPSVVDLDLLQNSGLDIILAEDDPINAFLLKTLLLQKGHRVRHFADFGPLAQELFDIDKERPDILLTDMSMPGGSGSMLVASLRTFERSRNLRRLPVLVLTAGRRIQPLEEVLELGADSVIQKPVDPEMLISAIEDLTEYHARIPTQH